MVSLTTHTFHFDPTYEHIHLQGKCELRFFCEAFSLMDSMKCANVLHRFTTRIRETNGTLQTEDLIEILRQDKLLTKDPSLSALKDFASLLSTIYEIVKEIVIDGFISCSRTGSLGEIAYHVGEVYQEKQQPHIAKEWYHLAKRLFDLAEFQQRHIRIHHDFQKSNYAPDPRTKNLYGGTAALIVFGLFYKLFGQFFM